MDFDYQVFYIDGMTVNEMVTENPDGSYTILINGDLCQKKQAKSLAHALRHITNGDFGKTDVQEIELNAHLTR